MPMTTTQIYRPTLRAGQVYARLAGSAAPMQSIGGIEVLELSIEEDTKKQTDFSRGGGGTRAQVKRVTGVMMKATLQDINPLNLARAVFGAVTEVTAGAVVAEAVVGYRGGLIALARINPTAVVVRKGAAVVVAATNYEVRPEGIFVLDNAVTIVDGDALTVDYSYGAYDVVQALTSAAPILEMRYAGVNEAASASASVVDLFRVQMGAAKKIGLIDEDFSTLEIEGEVLLDPSKTGVGVSKYFRSQTVTPAA